MSEKFTVAKLTGSENYASWAADLRIVLKHHRHWSWIEGTNEQAPSKTIVPNPKAPDAEIDNPAYVTWEEGATDALYQIMMTCEANVKDQIRQINVPSLVWKKLKSLYEPSNASTQFDYLSTIWSISLADYPSVTTYCSALEVAASNYLASGPTDFSHMLALITLMGLPSSYKVMQQNILSKAGNASLLLDSIKADLLNEERMLARENKNSEKANALQVHRTNNQNICRNRPPRTPEEKARFAEWVKTAQCRHCKQIGHIKVTCPAKSRPPSHALQTTSWHNSIVEISENQPEVELDALQATLEGDPSAYLASETKAQCYAWVIDSGCSHHMTLISDDFISFTSYSMP